MSAERMAEKKFKVVLEKEKKKKDVYVLFIHGDAYNANSNSVSCDSEIRRADEKPVVDII